MHPTTPLFARIHWYWPLQLAGWCCVPLFLMSYGLGIGTNLRFIAVCWWGAAAGMLLSDLWHRQSKRRWPTGQLPWRAMAVAVPALAAANTAIQTLGFVVFRPFGDIHGIAWLPQALLFWAGMHLGWNVCYATAMALRRASRFEAETLRLEVLAKDAELRALQAQVNPHFFFNSMNSVRALIYEDPDAAARMIDQLASLMRYALQSERTETVALAHELEAVHSYLAIEKIRFEERLRVSVHLEPGLERVAIPPMALQTLVENAVKHGVESRAGGSDIRIEARRHDGAVHIEIANQGTIVAHQNTTRVGLRNTRQRLALALGPAAMLDLSERHGWVRATLTLPAVA